MTQFLELSPSEYDPSEWRKCTPFLEHLKSSRQDLDLEGLNAAEEATVRFGFWCYQAGFELDFPNQEENKVTNLAEVRAEPAPEVIKMLTEILRFARQGGILSIAVATVPSDPKNIGNIAFHSRPVDKLSLVGAVEVVKAAILQGLTGQKGIR